MTDFNDLGRTLPEVVSRQLVATVNATREGRTIRPIGFIGKDILAIEKKITDPSEIIKQTQGFEISRLGCYSISRGNKSSILGLIGKKTWRTQPLVRNHATAALGVVLRCAKPASKKHGRSL